MDRILKNDKIKKVYFFVSFIILTLWLIFIFGMSAKTGEESAGLSYDIAMFLYKLFGNMSIEFDVFHTLIRKMAHFVEYGILGLLSINFINSCGIEIKKIIFAIVTFFCMIYAMLDEYHQSFVDGRGPGIRDVIIDTSGTIVFLIIFIVVRGIIRRYVKCR